MSAQSESRFKNPIRAEQVQARCDAILEDIFCDPIQGSINQGDKEALKEEHNRLSRELEDLRLGPLGDPLAALPPEIWTAIIQEATRENEANLSPIDALLVLTLVSTEWSAKILGNPLLWTEFAMGWGEADAQAKLETALFLSGGSFLNLLIHTRQFRWDVDFPLLQLHAKRIKQITFQSFPHIGYGPSVEPIGFAVLDRIFREINQFPTLEIIRRNGIWTQAQLSMSADFPLILKKSPVLTRIYGMDIPFEIARCRAGTPLRSYMIREASSTILRYIGDLGNVEELALVNDQLKPTSHRGETSLLHLPALRNLRRAEMDTSFISLLKRAGSLCCLEVTIKDKWQTLADFFEILDQLPCLTILDLILGKMIGKLVFPSINRTNTRVQDLKIMAFSKSLDIDQETISNAQTLFMSFPILFPKVRKLALWGVSLRSDIATYIRSISQLQSLQLMHISLDSAISIESANLETLLIDGTTGGDIKHLLSTAKCPRLSELRWYDAPVHTMPSLPHDGYKISICKNIRTLYINSPQARWVVPGFHTLKRLHVNMEDFSLSELFIHEPLSCPSLREMHLGFIPEWDLLFIMLERRNYLPLSQGVTRIQSLTLPRPVPPTIMAPLIEILSGRFTERPSNNDLSFCSFMDAYFDPSM
jgi:hypothetical protein